MNVTLLKALVMLVPGAILLAGSIALFLRQRTLYSLLQLLGAGSLVVVSSRMSSKRSARFPGWGGDRRTALVTTSISDRAFEVRGSSPCRGATPLEAIVYKELFESMYEYSTKPSRT